jgi:hypothetical protein
MAAMSLRPSPVRAAWSLCALAIVMAVAAMALGLTQDHRWLPGGELASWLGSWTNVPGIVLSTVFLPLLFPDGHVASRR